VVPQRFDVAFATRRLIVPSMTAETQRAQRARGSQGMRRGDLARINQTSGDIVESSIKVHRHFGPGLLESAYETCLAQELKLRGHEVRTQVPQPIEYEGTILDTAYRLDMLVDDQIIVELKTVDRILPLHESQLLSYLRLSERPLGLLINFKTRLLKDGIRRIVNGLEEPSALSASLRPPR
jgi:GxxExxY protein